MSEQLSEGEVDQAKSAEQEVLLEIVHKIALGFLKHRYPLSQAGEELKEKVQAAIDEYQLGDPKELQEIMNEIPTVENIRPELFADLEITYEEEEQIFGYDNLACVQLTKGCSRQCSFCAADASVDETGKAKHMEFMPFPAIIKLAQAKKRLDNERGQQAKQDREIFRQKIIELSGIDVDKFDWYDAHAVYKYGTHSSPIDQTKEIIDKSDNAELFRLRSEFSNFPQLVMEKFGIELSQNLSGQEIFAFLDQHYGDPRLQEIVSEVKLDTERIGIFRAAVEDAIELVPNHPSSQFYGNALKDVEELLYPLLCKVDFEQRYTGRSRIGKVVYLYYDSEPFDYRDSNFFHQDGTPADYSDALSLLASDIRPVSTTTAGWRHSSKISRTAGAKTNTMYQQDPTSLGEMRISINNTVHLAMQGDYHAMETEEEYQYYLDEMKRVIFVLKNTGAEINILVIGHADDFRQKVIKPLLEYIKDLTEKHQLYKEQLRMFPGIKRERQPQITFAGLERQGYELPGSYYKTNNDDYDPANCMPGIHVWPDGRVARQPSAEKGSRPQLIGKKIW